MNDGLIVLVVSQSIERSHRTHQHLESFVLDHCLQRHSQLLVISTSAAVLPPFQFVHRVGYEGIGCELLVETFLPELQLEVILLVVGSILEFDRRKTHFINKLPDRLFSPFPKPADLLQN
jgi:hypothetical protein